jgi:hypothetical protein
MRHALLLSLSLRARHGPSRVSVSCTTEVHAVTLGVRGAWRDVMP